MAALLRIGGVAPEWTSPTTQGEKTATAGSHSSDLSSYGKTWPNPLLASISCFPSGFFSRRDGVGREPSDKQDKPSWGTFALVGIIIGLVCLARRDFLSVISALCRNNLIRPKLFYPDVEARKVMPYSKCLVLMGHDAEKLMVIERNFNLRSWNTARISSFTRGGLGKVPSGRRVLDNCLRRRIIGFCKIGSRKANKRAVHFLQQRREQLGSINGWVNEGELSPRHGRLRTVREIVEPEAAWLQGYMKRYLGQDSPDMAGFIAEVRAFLHATDLVCIAGTVIG